MSDWQTMETAPKDGTVVLGFVPEYAGDERFQKIAWKWWANAWHEDGEHYSVIPTHWIPLVAPAAV